MGSHKSRPKVYTFPDCPKCDVLKEWLKNHGFGFIEKPFSTEVQLEFIMNNMFGSPPILELRDNAVPSEKLFPNDMLDELKLREVLDYAET